MIDIVYRMAFGKKQNKIEKLEAENTELQQALPFADDARAINIEIVKILSGGGAFTNSEIALRAIDLVRRRRHDEVYDSLAADYASEYEQELLTQLKNELRDKEGSAINEQVRASLDINPVTRKKLVETARASLWIEAEEKLTQDSLDREKQFVELELQRQTELNILADQFSESGELHMSQIKENLQLNDHIVLALQHEKSLVVTKLVYSLADKKQGSPDLGWRYLSGEVGASHGLSQQVVSKLHRLYRIGSHVSQNWGENLIFDWSILKKDMPVVVEFPQGENDNWRKAIIRDRHDTQITLQSVNILSPLAYAHYLEQTQN